MKKDSHKPILLLPHIPLMKTCTVFPTPLVHGAVHTIMVLRMCGHFLKHIEHCVHCTRYM